MKQISEQEFLLIHYIAGKKVFQRVQVYTDMLVAVKRWIFFKNQMRPLSCIEKKQFLKMFF